MQLSFRRIQSEVRASRTLICGTPCCPGAPGNTAAFDQLSSFAWVAILFASSNVSAAHRNSETPVRARPAYNLPVFWLTTPTA